MTNERRSKRERFAANSNGRRDAEDRPETGGPESLTERFAHACRLLGLQFDAGPVIVACSGGADSAAALVLLRRAASKARLVALYVNHQMRPAESIARDIAAVRAQARFAGASASVARVSIGS